MTALPPVPKCIQFQLLYTDGADTDIRNMLYFTYTQTLSSTDLQTLCNTMVTVWGSHMAGQTVQRCVLEGVIATDLSGPTSAEGSSSIASIPGTIVPATSQGLTSGAAFVMSNITALKYRGGHSRNYIPGLPQSGLLDANTWTVAFQTTIINAWAAFLQAFVSTAVPTAVGVLQQVVAHRFGKTAGAPVLSGVKSVPLSNPFTTAVTAHKTNPQVGSQRRRNQQFA